MLPLLDRIMEHYVSANAFMYKEFGCKVYKLALDAGFTCPNRDGTCGHSGCIFCKSGSGDFSIPVSNDVFRAIETAKLIVGTKCRSGKYIAYFQSNTNTYAPVSELETLFKNTISHPDIVALDIATRPDCLDSDKIALLEQLHSIKPVWIELGLQTIHDRTASYIRRGYPLSKFDETMHLLNETTMHTIVHMIVGLPGESFDDIYETASYIGHSGAKGIKIQLLHILEGTDLAADFRNGLFDVLSLHDYITLLEGCISRLPADMVIHRLTGDGAKRDLLAPAWSANKKMVMNAIIDAFNKDQLQQGILFSP